MVSTPIKLFKLYLLLLKINKIKSNISVLDFSGFIQLFLPATMQVSMYIFLNYLSTISLFCISFSKDPYQPKLLLFWVILNSALFHLCAHWLHYFMYSKKKKALSSLSSKLLIYKMTKIHTSFNFYATISVKFSVTKRIFCL